MHPDVLAAFAEIEARVLATDKFRGTLTTTWERTVEFFDKGFQWLIVMQDGSALVKAANEMTARLKTLNAGR